MYANVLFVSIPELVLIHRTIIKNLVLKLYFPLPHPVPQFPMGFSVAASVRVGNALGAGNTEQAKLSSKVALICAGMTQICENLHHSMFRDVAQEKLQFTTFLQSHVPGLPI